MCSGWCSPRIVLRDQLPHAPDLVGGGRALHRRLAQHGVADGDVADQPAGVDAQPPLESAQVVAVGVPAPGHALLERLARHSLDAHEALHQRVLPAVHDGRQREAAVAHHDGGDAVLRLGGGVRIP
jgi:hypothetical protein